MTTALKLTVTTRRMPHTSEFFELCNAVDHFYYALLFTGDASYQADPEPWLRWLDMGFSNAVKDAPQAARRQDRLYRTIFSDGKRIEVTAVAERDDVMAALANVLSAQNIVAEVEAQVVAPTEKAIQAAGLDARTTTAFATMLRRGAAALTYPDIIAFAVSSDVEDPRPAAVTQMRDLSQSAPSSNGHRHYRVISADGHCEFPAELIEHRIPEKYRDVAPRLVTKDDGTEWWRMDEWERNNVGNLVCDLPYDEWVPPIGARYHTMDGTRRPGTGDAVQRLREQDLDGIDAEVLYPPVYMGAFIRNLAGKDAEAYKAIIRGYNTFLGEDYCSVAPDRLIGNAMVLETGVDDAIAEMERCKEMGLRSVCLRMWPSGGPEYSPDDDRFFAAALDLDVKISPHQSFGGAAPAFTSTGQVFTGAPITPMGGGSTAFGNIAQLINHGVFDKFPGLRIYFAETQGGWLAHSLNWADEFYLRWYSFRDAKLTRLPTEYFRDHCRFSFIADRMGARLHHYIGTDVLMWGSDFPHSVGTFPYTPEVIEELFEGVAEDERRKMLCTNACEFFDLDTQAVLTATP
jgi:uncharacterized protein